MAAFRSIGTLLLAAPIVGALAAASSCDNSGGSPAGGGTAASGSGAGGSGSAPVAVGTPMKASDGESVTVTAFGAAPPSGNQFETPAPGKECVQVSLTFTNGSSSEWSLPTTEVAVVDQSGQKYDLSSSINCGAGDDISAVVAGGHASAKELFEVPKGSPLNLTWTPNAFESAVYQTKLR